MLCFDGELCRVFDGSDERNELLSEELETIVAKLRFIGQRSLPSVDDARKDRAASRYSARSPADPRGVDAYRFALLKP